MAITLSQLASFLAVAREGSVSGAAHKLFVTQPSISAAVSALSKEVGVELTERVGRGVALTPAGQALRPFAADVLGLIEEGKLAAREASDQSQRRLRILAVATAGEFLLPALLKEFGALHPEIDLVLEVANRATLFQRLLEHDADIAIAGRPPEDARIAGDAFLANELVLITASDDPLAAAKSVAPEQLAERTWLQREEGSGTRQLVSEFLDGPRSPPEDADPRLERRREAGGADRARRLAPVAPRGRLRARRRDAGRDQGSRRAAAAGVVRAAAGGDPGSARRFVSSWSSSRQHP